MSRPKAHYQIASQVARKNQQAEQPAEQTIEQPAAQTTEQPAAQTTEQPAAQNTEQPAAQHIARPIEVVLQRLKAIKTLEQSYENKIDLLNRLKQLKSDDTGNLKVIFKIEGNINVKDLPITSFASDLLDLTMKMAEEMLAKSDNELQTAIRNLYEGK